METMMVKKGSPDHDKERDRRFSPSSCTSMQSFMPRESEIELVLIQ